MKYKIQASQQKRRGKNQGKWFWEAIDNRKTAKVRSAIGYTTRKGCLEAFGKAVNYLKDAEVETT
jgi:hypothetical protein